MTERNDDGTAKLAPMKVLTGVLLLVATAYALQAKTGESAPAAAEAATQVNVKAHGAVGDGSSDDSGAINAAIAAAKTGGAGVYFPPGHYRLRSPLNATDLAGITLEGPAITTTDPKDLDDPARMERMALLLGDTGSIVIDTLGSERIRIRNLGIRVRSSFANPSKVGILLGRSSSHNWAQFNVIENVLIYMDSNPSATSRGTVAVYNVAAEHFSMFGCHLVADQALAVASTNVLGISSPYRGKPSGPASMSVATLMQNVFRSWTHAGSEFWGVYSTSCYDCYWSRQPSSKQRWAITLNNVRQVNFTGQIEEFPAALLIGEDSESVHTRLTLVGPSEAYVWLDNATLRSSNLAMYSTVGGKHPFLGGAGAVLGSVLNLGNSTGVNNEKIRLEGTQLLGSAAARVMADEASSYILQKDDRTVAQGGIQLAGANKQPKCDGGTRGLMWIVPGGPGDKDRVEVCAKDAADRYSWRTIY